MTDETNPPKPPKCRTCYGHGMWGIGHAAPMGPMDARDGMPTVACPECAANRNPRKGEEGVTRG